MKPQKYIFAFLESNFLPKMPQSAILLLAKGAKGASCAKLIMEALESPDFFEFTELLTMSNIKELQHTPNFGNAFNQLVAFAHFTFLDYPTNLPPLTPGQQQKLRILTIARLAQKHCVSIMHCARLNVYEPCTNYSLYRMPRSWKNCG